MKNICFEEIQNLCGIVYHLRGYINVEEAAAVYCICEMRWSDPALNLHVYEFALRFNSKSYLKVAD